MKRLLLALALLAGAVGSAHAFTITVLSSGCSTAAPKPGADQLFMDTTGNLCTGTVFSGTVTTSGNISQWGGTATSLGQKLMAASVPVVIASDQGAFTVNLGTIGSAATAAAQATGNTSLAAIAAALTNPLPVSMSSTAVTPTDRGGTITAGGTAQNAMASNASRKGGWIQNPCSATEDLFVSTSTTATVTGASDDADLAPCGTFSLSQNGLVIQSAVSVIAATTSHRWLGKETQ